MGMSATAAGLFSMLFDVGQLIGAMAAGAATDRMTSRAPLTLGLCSLACPLLWYLQGLTGAPLVCMLLLLGFCLGGPANMITGCISADLGTHPSLSGNVRAIATVTGIIDGTGSVGAAAAQYIVGALAPPPSCKHTPEGCGWKRVFQFLTIANAVACVCMLPTLQRRPRNHR